MAPPSRKILVVGATGVIGKVLTNALINSKDSFERIGIFTSAETLANKAEEVESLRQRGVSIISGDIYNDDDVLEAYKGSSRFPAASVPVLTVTGFDTVVSAVGRFAIDKQVDLIALAERSPSIVRFIPSEYGTDIAWNASSATEVPHQKKLKVRAFLERPEAVRSNLAYTYLVTGPFADLYVGAMAKEPQVDSHFADLFAPY